MTGRIHSGAHRLAIALAIGMIALPSAAGDRASDDVQAIFIANVVKFVKWPAERFADEGSPILIGVPTGHPVAAKLSKRLVGKSVHGRPVRVEEIASLETAEIFHLLFLGDGSVFPLRDASRSLRGTSTVTVAESRRFAERGGVLAFQMVDSKVQFEINLRTAKRGGIELSSRLLDLASEIY